MGEGVSNGAAGRWPANVMHDGSDEVVGLFPNTTSRSSNAPQPIKTSKGIKGGAFGNDAARKPGGHPTHPEYVRGGFDDSGSAARFFYCAKASKRDRDEGLEGLAERDAGVMDDDAYVWPLNGDGSVRNKKVAPRRNHHPTVKPTALMRYLCRLITPPGGVVLDPFTGSGSTGKAAVLEGFGFVGIEKGVEYLAIAERRIEHARMQPSLLAEAAE